jgi:AraC-like DNA-binding protein
MDAREASSDATSAAWMQARSGDLKGAADAARRLLRERSVEKDPGDVVELHLVCASCAIRQGDHAKALASLEAAGAAAARPHVDARLSPRVQAWRAELAYFQGRYSEANDIASRLLPELERTGDLVYAAFILRVRIAILLARGDYDAVAGVADRAVALAEASGDAYVQVQICNVLGAVHFDRATSKLREPHARAHLSALDTHDLAPMESDARDALRHFERARALAEEAGYEFAAWYVAGNIERLEILLGRPQRAVALIRRRLEALQERGARYDEIVTRSNLAWALRLLGRHREALHELDVALTLARHTGTSNVMLEYLEYDRSIVLDALGDAQGARAAYRRYTQLVAVYNRATAPTAGQDRPVLPKRPLEPGFLKRADRFLQDRLLPPFAVAELAQHCGVSVRTLENAFVAYRGATPVAHARNARLDLAHREIHAGNASVADVARRCGFRSTTTFSLEYRKRFGVPPSRTKRSTA